jgi:NAD-dependent SIR2 family protein deacetylase
VRIRSVDFPIELIHAIRRENLVVFAGAGVSMGPPANLPSFARLAENIARLTGQQKKQSEPEDRFFGRLHKEGYPVHLLAATELKTTSGSHTALHRDLLRLFKDAAKLRIVTTNFDMLFEEASMALFGESVEVHTSPALPLGRDFAGIVHVHGSCDKTNCIGSFLMRQFQKRAIELCRSAALWVFNTIRLCWISG